MFGVKLPVLFLCCVFAVSAHPTNEDDPRSNTIQTEDDLLDTIYHECLRKDTISCLKLKIYNYVDRSFNLGESYALTKGVEIVKTGVDQEGAPRAITNEDSLESLVMSRIGSFLSSHTLKVNVKGSDVVNAVASAARSLNDVAESYEEAEEEDNSLPAEESRGKKMKKSKKKKGMMGHLMGGLGIMSMVIGKIFLLKVALIAKKALIIAKIAFVISAFLAIKKLLASKGGSEHKHATYEIVSHPEHHASHDSSGSGGWGGDWSGSSSAGWDRNVDAQKMAYRGHAQAQV